MMPILAIDNRTPFNQMFYFKGQNLGLTTQAKIQVLAFVCGQEFYFVNTTHPVFNNLVTRNATVVANPKLTYNISSAIYAQSIQTWVSPDDCPVDHYKVATDSACTSPITDQTRFKITGGMLEIGLGTPIVETTVYLCAFNSIESALLTKSSAMKIEICGHESIGLATPGALSYNYDLTTQLNSTSIDV